MAQDPHPDAKGDDSAPATGAWAAAAAGDWAFNAQFFLLTAPPLAGKTEFLRQCASSFAARGLRVGGVLAPLGGERGPRQLVLLQSAPAESIPLEIAGDSAAPGVEVGKFLLDETALARARAELTKAGEMGACDWVIVDEVGPLELKRQGGLEPAVGELLRAAARGELGPPQPRFLIVVRSSLRDELVSTYGLDGTGCAEIENDESPFPGFLPPGARAAAVVDLAGVPATPAEAEGLIGRFCGLPPLL
eukprot:TRINITY_DN21817_c0_g1_i1.p1 TRINITY_DN21817_c0_g1~~TRINITY_DN21817_c0_g1_i1.p1  ORF type:complete len:265 (+),score=63.36 TRINITY_DN21817_c0_g1_i1:52-795(+)